MVLRAISLIGILLLVSCGSGSQEVKQREQAEENQEPMNTTEARDVFVRNCESCHGMDGRKQAAGAADLSLTKKPDAEIREMILKGNDKGMMPYEDLLTQREIDGLVEFVKSLRTNQ